jgi:hypothetical protein
LFSGHQEEVELPSWTSSIESMTGQLEEVQRQLEMIRLELQQRRIDRYDLVFGLGQKSGNPAVNLFTKMRKELDETLDRTER